MNEASTKTRSKTSLETWPVMEHFYTIQGEGYHTGAASYFIRLGGCDIGCPWCDVKDSWPAEAHAQYSLQTMVQWVIDSKCKKLVITGGEPLTYNLDLLCEAMHNIGVDCHIETSGAFPYSGSWEWFTLSPKKRMLPKEENYQKANELKVVIARPNDFKFAESQAAKVAPKCKLYLQPEWSKEKEILPEIIAYIKANPQWRISLQSHKYMSIP